MKIENDKSSRQNLNLDDVIQSLLSSKTQENTITFEITDSIFNANDIIAGDSIKFTTDNINDLANLIAEKLVDKSGISDRNLISTHNPNLASEEISNRIKEAEELQKKRNFRLAHNLYLDITTDYSIQGQLNKQALFNINNNIGICYLNLSENDDYLEKAKKHFDRAFELKEGQEEERIYLTFSWYFKEIGEIEKSFEHAKKAIEIKPDYVKALNVIALIRNEQGDALDKILADIYFDENCNLKEVFVSDSSALMTLGQLYLMNNDHDNAIKYLTETVNQDQYNFLAMALLGDAFLFKGLREKRKLNRLTNYSELDYKSLYRSIDWYEKAFNLATQLNLIHHLKNFLNNNSAAYFYLGNYQNAYEKIKTAIQFGINNEDLIKNKAVLEATSGDFDLALETYKSIPGIASHIETCHLLLFQGQFEKVIHEIQALISSKELDNENTIWCKEILADAYLKNDQIDESFNVLQELKYECELNWRIRILWAKYFEKCNNISESSDYLEIALTESNYHSYAFFELVEFYFRTKQYSVVILVIEKLEINLPIRQLLADYICYSLIKAYYFQKDYLKAIETALTGIENGVASEKIRYYLAEAYIHQYKFYEANKIFIQIYHEDPQNYNNLINCALTYFYMGRIEESIKYFKRAERLNEAKSDSSFFINYSRALLLLGDERQALSYGETAKNLDIDKVKSISHSYYIHLAIRCGETNNAFDYLYDFHSKFPKVDFIKSLKLLENDEGGQKSITSEFREFLNNSRKNFEKGIFYYKSNPMPLHFLSFYFKKNLNEIYAWKTIYKIPIVIDSGNHKLQYKEIEAIKNENSLIVDFLSLIVVNNLGLIEIFFKDFNKIYIPYSLLNEIQISILMIKDPEIISLWQFIRKSEKSYFLASENNFNTINKNLVEVLGVSNCDCLELASKFKYTFCLGDENLKRFADSTGIKVTGIHALLNRLFENKRIDLLKLAKAKAKLLAENHTFISFNANDLIAVYKESQFNFTDEIMVFFDIILKTHPNINSFIRVYVDTFIYLFKNDISKENISAWLIKYIEIFQVLFKRSYTGIYYPGLFGQPPKEKVGKYEIDAIDLYVLAIKNILVLIDLLGRTTEEREYLTKIISKHINHHFLLKIYYNEILPEAKVSAESIRNKLLSVKYNNEKAED
ncbi:MAG: hypothetical protein JXA99_03840 [Candidatus Lokiarchaeota archaeon]|nr:hypothetical protein [Candidatus Lokiarchaeota archaeon]